MEVQATTAGYSIKEDIAHSVTLGMVWSIAIAGMIMELIVKKRYKRISISSYLGLGWQIMIAIEPIITNGAPGGSAA